MSTFKEIMENPQGNLNNYKIPIKNESETKLIDEDGKEIIDKTVIDDKAKIVDVFQTPLTYVEPDSPMQLDTLRFSYSFPNMVPIGKLQGNRCGYICPPPPPPPPPLPEEEFIKRYPYLNRGGFPEPLKQLLQPLACQLCKVRLNSRISGQMHYSSKLHSKKIHIWLQEWEKQTGEPAPKRVKVVKESLPAGPNAYRCEVCDIALTSVQHADQHYSGKKHRAVVMGFSTPSGSGYYDANKKWIRMQPETSSVINFYNSTPVVGTKPLIKTPPVITSTDPAVYCSVCNINVSRESQMKAHLEGSRHAKKLKSVQAPPYAAPLDNILTNVTSSVLPVKDTLVVLQQKIDISIYRTPSGSFYCQLCDITVETENLFNQHLNCKKHIRKQNTNGKE